MPKDFLTATDFYRYLQCPHWPYWERFGDTKLKRPKTKLEELCQSDGLAHEKKIVKKYFGDMCEIKIASREDGYKKTLQLMKKGAPIIYQGWLLDNDWVGRPDILEKHDGKSALGNWYYVPLDIKRAHELKKEHKAQLIFYALLLEKIQKRFPAEPGIVNGDGDRLPFQAETFLSEFERLREAIERIRDKEIPDPVYRKSCYDSSPWHDACFKLAYERNDIALLFNVDVRKLASLRNVGIHTVDDAAALDPEKLEGQAWGLTLRALQTIKNQARSLREALVMIRKPFQDKHEGLEIHFDIESYPPTDTDYLFGFWIGSPPHYKSFLAPKLSDEKKMWKAFLKWLSTLPEDFTIYHYANYEVGRLGVLARRYGDGDNPWLKKFISRMVDLKEAVREHVTLPLYFYSLKKICKFLGFHWQGEVQGGSESVEAFEKWRKTKKRSILKSILQYNEEDVRATAFLLDWLRRYATKEKEFFKPYAWEK